MQEPKELINTGEPYAYQSYAHLYKSQINESQINWLKCHEFATSNFVKMICNYKNEHNDMTLHEISNKLHISYKTVQHNVKVGNANKEKNGRTDFYSCANCATTVGIKV